MLSLCPVHAAPPEQAGAQGAHQRADLPAVPVDPGDQGHHGGEPARGQGWGTKQGIAEPPRKGSAESWMLPAQTLTLLSGPVSSRLLPAWDCSMVGIFWEAFVASMSLLAPGGMQRITERAEPRTKDHPVPPHSCPRSSALGQPWAVQCCLCPQASRAAAPSGPKSRELCHNPPRGGFTSRTPLSLTPGTEGPAQGSSTSARSPRWH